MFTHRPGSVEVATDAYLVARDIEDLDKRITRTEEWMCSSVIFTGKCEILDWDTDRHLATLEYDPVIETLVSLPWTDPASKPLDDLKACIRAISSASNSMADVVVFGAEAASLFENNESVQIAFDRRFIFQGEIRPEQREWGGNLAGIGPAG